MSQEDGLFRSFFDSIRPMVLIEGVSKHFHHKPVLESGHLTLAPGGTHVLLGSSSSGKTTLLKLIAGTLAPNQGSVTVHGVRVTVADPCPPADRLGYMTQEGGLFPHLGAGDKVTRIYQGRVLQHGAFAELAKSPAHPYVTEFLMAQRSLPQLAQLGS